MTQRVKCFDCENLILPQTAKDNDGLCAQCVKVSPELRTEKRDYECQLAEGLVFTPSVAERESSLLPPDVMTGRWQLHPEYYGDRNFTTVMDAIIAAKTESVGDVFLVSDLGGEMNLGFTDRYGVCEYQNQGTGDFRYAYTRSNLVEQVPQDLHVVQACPCCGVGMFWYPSRFHMPRALAFSIIENAVCGRESADVEWLESGDFSYTEHGRG